MPEDQKNARMRSVYIYGMLAVIFLVNGVIYLKMGRTLLGVLDLILTFLDALYAWAIWRSIQEES